LSEEAQSKAVETARNKWEVELYGFEEGCKDQIEEAGFIEPKLQYSVGWCQGDGLSFSAKDFDLEKLTEMFIEVLGKDKSKTANLIAENCVVVCTGNTGHYCYAHRRDIDLYIDWGNDVENICSVVSKVREKLEDLYMDLCKDLEAEGY